ncbi:MAG: hypothetical protein JWO56_1479 [Acidobacteria bacterium]|nr:hypothetical protein [Acidobacteriota bacterium]
MKIRNVLAATTMALLPLTMNAASLIVPAAGSGNGVNGSHWQSELTFHNVSSRTITAQLIYHDETHTTAASAVPLAGRTTVSVEDVVRTRFGIESGTGAIEIVIADAEAASIAVSSRTTNVSDRGEFGQDIPAVSLNDAAKSGDLTVLAAPSSKDNYRFNFGLYAATAATVHWELLRADGTIAATKDVTYAAGTQKQYNGGVVTLLGADARDNDTVHATLLSGSAVFYGSAINNVSGDPAFVPGIRTLEDVHISFAGIDLDENGTVDVADANHDGVLDAPIDLYTSTFPNYFRVVATGENGQAVTYELVNPPAEALLIDSVGTISFAPGANVAGTTGDLLVRATAGSNTAILRIPVRYR